MLAHELRNPLAPIRNALRSCGAGPATPTRERARDDDRAPGRSTWCGWSTTCSTSRASPAARSSCGGSGSSWPTVVDRAVEASRPLLEERRPRPRRSALPPEPIWLDADPARLAQVIANLLNNAAKYTDAGRPHRAARQPRGRRGRGAGARQRHRHRARDAAAQIFELFAQATARLDRAAGRAGHRPDAGAQLVEMHGGTVAARARARPAAASSWCGCRSPRALGREAAPTDDGARARLRPAAACWWSTTTSTPPTARRCCSSCSARTRVEVAHDGIAAVGRRGAAARTSSCSTSACPAWTATRWPRAARPPRARRRAAGRAHRLRAGEDRRRSREAGFDEHLVKPARSTTCSACSR